MNKKKVFLTKLKLDQYYYKISFNLGTYIDHYECYVCERLHENIERDKKGQPPIIRQATKEHYGCPEPYTFTESGILLNKNDKNEKTWVDSKFKFSYEFSYVEQKIFFDKFLKNKIYNFTYKMLRDSAFKYYYDEFRKNGNKIDLK